MATAPRNRRRPHNVHSNDPQREQRAPGGQRVTRPRRGRHPSSNCTIPPGVLPDDVPVLPGAAGQQAQPQARGQAADFPGGYDCDFVQPPPEAVQSECPICHLVLREPYQAPCCGNSFCRTCIEPVRLSNANCPTCRRAGFTTFPDKRLERSLNPLKVFCSQRRTSCEWKGELSVLEEHLNDNPTPSERLSGCNFVEVNCVHCAQPFQRRRLDTHEKTECRLRPYSCDHCGEFASSYENVVDLHHPVCEHYPMPCPNKCIKFEGASIARRDLERHVKEACLLSKVECDCHYAGCETRLLRKDMASHLTESLVTHMSLMAAHGLEKNKLIEQLRNDQAKQVEKIKKLESEIESLSSKLEPLQSPFYTPPCTFTMTNFIQHKNYGRVWNSPPFYTKPRGHKLHIQVQCVAHNMQPLIAVSVCKMAGEFDDCFNEFGREQQYNHSFANEYGSQQQYHSISVSIQVQCVSQLVNHINFEATVYAPEYNEVPIHPLPQSSVTEVDLVSGCIAGSRPFQGGVSKEPYFLNNDCVTFEVISTQYY